MSQPPPQRASLFFFKVHITDSLYVMYVYKLYSSHFTTRCHRLGCRLLHFPVRICMPGLIEDWLMIRTELELEVISPYCNWIGSEVLQLLINSSIQWMCGLDALLTLESSISRLHNYFVQARLRKLELVLMEIVTICHYWHRFPWPCRSPSSPRHVMSSIPCALMLSVPSHHAASVHFFFSRPLQAEFEPVTLVLLCLGVTPCIPNALTTWPRSPSWDRGCKTPISINVVLSWQWHAISRTRRTCCIISRFCRRKVYGSFFLRFLVIALWSCHLLCCLCLPTMLFSPFSLCLSTARF